ncbi:MAG: Gliding motility-associated C-terminal protein [Chitinophagaceae bacterium]|nr:Gliding motility-associated C-terminal protein [Chitinophagaceae bacterium]
MKRIVLSIFILCCTLASLANHITGGEMSYTFIGMEGANYKYLVTLKLYRNHFAPAGAAPLDDAASIAVYTSDNVLFVSFNVPRLKIVNLELTTPGACVTNPPSVWYEVGYYEQVITLPASTGGYTVAYQRCCRISGINNISGSNNVGATYTAIIPGNGSLLTGPENNSAHFVGADTVVICADNPFTYSFAASDEDADSLSYSFCSAYRGGSSGNPAPDPPDAPPYQFIPYAGLFNSNAPMGSGVNLNRTTGLITGIAPAEGIYCVTVCVTEYRNGIALATQRKDLQIKVADCTLAAASLRPEYISCDGFTLDYFNLSNSPLINSYFWDFGVPSLTNDTSNIARPSFTYSDTGVYKLKLVTNRGQLCSDSAEALVKVFPGFFPGFISTGICITNPTQFTDTTRTRYGFVDTWKWTFGESTLSEDTSRLQNPSYTYPGLGVKSAMLIVTNSKGCIDTAYKDVTIIDKPPITMVPKDTLICLPDVVQLQAISSGVYSWSPLTNIINANTATPTVSPATTTWYYVDVDDQGCKNRDSARVRVVDHVTLKALPDSTICLGDNAQMNAVTDGLGFQWQPAAYLNDATLINPVATPPATTTFQLTASIGTCSATDAVTIRTVPYPVANAGNDVAICYNASVRLNGSYTGTTFSWSPTSTLDNPLIINPVASPFLSTSYILTVSDNAGCPKPGRDTVLVAVLPKVNAFAGRDTAIVAGQPLQFNASGGSIYLWSPPTGLSSIYIGNPVGIYETAIDSIRYKVIVMNEAGCSDSATVKVKVFITKPQVFVPTAFTPNGDGHNDIVRPIAVGITQIDYFRIYNRWGELVFSTTTNEQGWDGKINGVLQGSNTYVWIVHAIDYTGKTFFSKGTVTLIR